MGSNVAISRCSFLPSFLPSFGPASSFFFLPVVVAQHVQEQVVELLVHPRVVVDLVVLGGW
jgi:hypothetical protein